MRKVFRLVAMFCLAATAGCGYVEGNYPQIRTEAPKELPEQYQVKGSSKRLVWQETDSVRGFLFGFESAEQTVARLDDWARRGGAQAARELPLFQPMAKEGLAHVTMLVFASPGFMREVRRGDIQVNFSDGSSVADLGIFLYPVRGAEGMPRSTRFGGVPLDGQIDEDMKGRTMFVFVPGEYADRTVESVSFQPVKSTVAGK